MVARSELVAQGYRDAQGHCPRYAVEGYLCAWAGQLVGPSPGNSLYWASQERDEAQALRLRKAGQVLAPRAEHFSQEVDLGLNVGATALRRRVRELNDLYQYGQPVYKEPVGMEEFLAEEFQAGYRLGDPAVLAAAMTGYSGDVAADPETLEYLQTLAAALVPDPQPLLNRLVTHPPMVTREAILVDALERHLAATLSDDDEITAARKALSKLGANDPTERREAYRVKTVLRKWVSIDFDRCDTIPALFPALPASPDRGGFWKLDAGDRVARLNIYRATMLAMRVLDTVTNSLITEASDAIGEELPSFEKRNRRDLVKGELTRVMAELMAYHLLVPHATRLGTFLQFRDSWAGIDDGDLATAGLLAGQLAPLAGEALELVTGKVAGQEAVPSHTLSHDVVARQLRLHDDLQDLQSLPVEYRAKTKTRVTNWRRVHVEPLADDWLGRVIETADGDEWFHTPRMGLLLTVSALKAKQAKLLRVATNHYIFRGVGFEELAIESLLRYQQLSVTLRARLTHSARLRADALGGDWAAVADLDQQAWEAACADDTAGTAEHASQSVTTVLGRLLERATEDQQRLLLDWFATHYIMGLDPVRAAMKRMAFIVPNDGKERRSDDPVADIEDALRHGGGTPADHDGLSDPVRTALAQGLDARINAVMPAADRAELDKLLSNYVQENLFGMLAALLAPSVANTLRNDQLRMSVVAVQHALITKPLTDLQGDEDPLITSTLLWADRIVDLATRGDWQASQNITSGMPAAQRAELDRLVSKYVEDNDLGRLAAMLTPAVANTLGLPGGSMRAVQQEFITKPLTDLQRDEDPLITSTLLWADQIVDLAARGYWRAAPPADQG